MAFILLFCTAAIVRGSVIPLIAGSVLITLDMILEEH